MVSVKAQGWRLFDELIYRAETTPAEPNPWCVSHDGGDLHYRPDYATLCWLLAVPRLLNATSQSGVPALALDVWTSYELRRAGFARDAVWPRPAAPRVLPTEVAALLSALPARQRTALEARIAKGDVKGAVAASANVLGKNYVKQVDVVISAWNTGPELMVSTKRMDSSFGKNAANRVEESYGDAKNLRLRHPQSALGFLYGLRSTALAQEPDKTDWLIDLLTKLGKEDDAYDAVGLVIPDWLDSAPADDPDDGGTDDDDDPLVEAGVVTTNTDAGEAANLSQNALSELVAQLTPVGLRRDAVPAELDPGRFFGVMVRRVLDSCPVNFHRVVRSKMSNPSSAPMPTP